MKILQYVILLILFQAMVSQAETPLIANTQMTIRFNQQSPIDSIGRIYKKAIKRNAVYVEIGGNAILYSLNYDRIIIANKYVSLSGRIGVAIHPPSLINGYSCIFPIELNALFFNKMSNHLEIGVGVTPWRWQSIDAEQKELTMFSSFRIGYRFQNLKKNGFVYRVAITPFRILIPEIDKSVIVIPFIPWGGLSVGYSF